LTTEINYAATRMLVEVREGGWSSDQHTPTFSAKDVQTIISFAKGQYRMLYALLAGTGMRMGEVSGLEIDKHIIQDASTIKIQQSVWSGSVQTRKPLTLCERLISLPPLHIC